MKKVWTILLILLSCAAVGIGIYWYVTQATPDIKETTEEPTEKDVETTDVVVEELSVEGEIVMVEAEEIVEITEQTNGLVMFEDLALDTMMLGKWQHAIDTGWYRVYTMEPAGDDYYWGREWNTSDDILEEDLTPYGNGWFKWKKDGDNVVELHMTENQIVSVPYEYKMLRLSNQEMRYKETADAEKQQFNKCLDW